MEYYLGVDQGGTKTAALVCDRDGRALGAGYEAGLITVYHQDEEGVFTRRIRSAAEAACAEAGIRMEQVTLACGSLNGADWDFEYPVLQDKLRDALGLRDVIVVNDCIGAMRAGSSAPDRAVVCAGSGLNAAVRNSGGDEIIYGYYIDAKYQGGGALGAAAIRKMMESHIGLCGETALTGMVLDFTGRKSAEELMIDITTRGYLIETKRLAPLLIQAYADGDAEAIDAAEEFSRGVARYITAGMKRLGILGSAADLVFSGGVFKGKGSLLAERIYEIICETARNIRAVHAKLEPVCGAALIALDRAYGGAAPDCVGAAIDAGAEKFGLIRNIDRKE